MKITFVGPLISTFVSNDVLILGREHQLDTIDAAIGKGRSAALRLIRLHMRIITSLLSRDAVFFWFADYYTLLPSLVARLVGKKVYVVAGGFDITYLPHLGIGARTRPLRWFAVRNTFKLAHRIFPVSQDTQNDLDDAVPGHAPSTMIYNAVDTGKYAYKRIGGHRVALTVSQADSLAEYKRKGIDVFIELARKTPDVNFRIVGVRGAVAEEASRYSKTIPNLTVVPGRVPLEDLLEEFWKAPVYCQPSVEERFGVSVAEAMSCGCIPVVAPVNALKEVVGSAGYIIDREDLAGMQHALYKGLEAPEEAHLAAHQEAAQFDIEERAKKLLALVR